MIDLEPIKDRLAAAAANPEKWDDDKAWLVLNAPADLAVLVAEVERLREENRILRFARSALNGNVNWKDITDA